VRIALDPQELTAHPLRVGLSVAANVDVRDTSGPQVTDQMAGGTMTADTGADTTASSDAIIAKILADNGAGQTDTHQKASHP